MCALLLAACVSSRSEIRREPPQQKIMLRVQELLDRYAANDQAGVINMLDPEGFTIFGSDISEVVRSAEQLRQLMSDDFRLWGTARFSDVREVDVRVGDDLATAHFVASFHPGDAPNGIPVRFATTWRKAGRTWVLTQSANAVPTVGQSAAEILRKQ